MRTIVVVASGDDDRNGCQCEKSISYWQFCGYHAEIEMMGMYNEDYDDVFVNYLHYLLLFAPRQAIASADHKADHSVNHLKRHRS